ncbi:hypothetical protein B0A48_13215 [Cryoendolithus antarcticus]|uniref:Carboxy-cis,cis-muconate cyclase n=1 Tax=Cryoendolithus antarcticus TaxID=1507870 RepID=A0A1V8SNT7_9PEZI|nr:hypothetical protein B0A48_13215 [Cryoendolithus antarcticus]
MKSVILATSIAGLLAIARGATHDLLVGTFVQKSIYTLRFDDKANTLRLVGNTSVRAPSSWITLSKDQKHLYGTDYEYIVGQTDRTDLPRYLSFSVRNSTSIVHEKTLKASHVCNGSSIYIAQSPFPPYNVYGADFWSYPGCGNVMSVDSDAGLDRVVQDFRYGLPESSVHGLDFQSRGRNRRLYSADTHGNAIWTHEINTVRGTVVVRKPHMIAGPSAGANPRHVVAHASGRAIYAVMEGSSEVVSYALNGDGVPLRASATIFSILPPGTNLTAYWGDAAAISASGTVLWATTRARDPAANGFVSAFDLDPMTGAILRQNFLVETSSSGGVANAVSPSQHDGRVMAITDNAKGFVEIWEMSKTGDSVKVVAHLDLADTGNSRYKSGCCANAVWLPSGGGRWRGDE